MKTKMILAMAAVNVCAAAASVCGAENLYFASGSDWKITNYSNRLKIDKNATVAGEKCLAVYGATNKCDTAFKAASRRVALPPGTREIVVSVETKGSRLIASNSEVTGNWCNTVTWFDADGQRLSTRCMPHVIVPVSAGFSRMQEWMRVPEKAGSFSVALAFDSPNLEKNDAVFYRSFTVEPVPAGTSREAEFKAAWEDGSWLRDILYPQVSRTVPKVTLRDDGFTLVDGEPFFPIGIYSVCRREFNGNSFDRAFAGLKEAGFNFAHTYGNAYDPEFLAAARKYGFKLWVEARMPDDKMLNVGRHDPSILAWYIGDDTSVWRTPQELTDNHLAVKAVDPNRITCQADAVHSESSISHYAAYVRSTDVFMPEIYPVQRETGHITDTTCVARTIADMERVREDVRIFGDGRPRACWPILQWFSGWTCWLHFPSVEQLRATSWAAIIHGAHGITWYTYGGYVDKKKGTRNEGITSTPERWRAIADLATHIKRVSPILLERTPADQPAVSIVEGPALDPLGVRPSVSCLLKRRNGKDYLFAVNASPKPVVARFRFSGGIERTERFAPFGVIVPEKE